jgi:hypothetical protein
MVLSGMRIAAGDPPIAAWKPVGGVGYESADRGAVAISGVWFGVVCAFRGSRARTAATFFARGVETRAVRGDHPVWDCAESSVISI